MDVIVDRRYGSMRGGSAVRRFMGRMFIGLKRSIDHALPCRSSHKSDVMVRGDAVELEPRSNRETGGCSQARVCTDMKGTEAFLRSIPQRALVD